MTEEALRLLREDAGARRCYLALTGHEPLTIDAVLDCYGDDPTSTIEPGTPSAGVIVPAELVEQIEETSVELRRWGYLPPTEDQLYEWLRGHR